MEKREIKPESKKEVKPIRKRRRKAVSKKVITKRTEKREWPKPPNDISSFD